MPGPHASESCCANSGNPCSRQPPRPHQLPPARNLPRPKNSPRGCFCPAVRWTRGPGFSIPALLYSLPCIIKRKKLNQRQIVKDFLIKFTKNLQKRCQKRYMAPDTSFDRLHCSGQQVLAEIRIVWQLVDIWLPAPLDFGQFQRIGCFQRVIVARHIQNIRSNIIQTPAAKIGG